MFDFIVRRPVCWLLLFSMNCGTDHIFQSSSSRSVLSHTVLFYSFFTARIILDAAYEATLWAALISSLEEKPHVTIKDTTTIDTQLTELSISSDGENVAPDSATTSPHTTDYCKDVFLTFLGGGVFGNDNEWIASAIGRALAIMAHHKVDLNVHICHFRRVDEVMAKMIDESYDMYLAELSAGNEV